MKKQLILYFILAFQGFSQNSTGFLQETPKATAFLSHKALMDKVLKRAPKEAPAVSYGKPKVNSPNFITSNDKFHRSAKLMQTSSYCNCDVRPLAVTAIQLEAERLSDEKVQLRWTATELTNDNKFGIERSIDAKAFTNIGLFSTQSKAAESEYRYEDSNDSEDVTYYRIKEKDLNGKVIYSNVVAVLGADLEAKISVSPNPTTGKVSISLVSEDYSNGHFTVFTASGRQVLQKAFLFEKGKNNATIDISEFAIGTYFLQINNGKNKTTKKIVKR